MLPGRFRDLLDSNHPRNHGRAMPPNSVMNIGPTRSSLAAVSRLATSSTWKNLPDLQKLASLMFITLVRRVCITSWSSTCSARVSKISSTTAIAAFPSRRLSWLLNRWCVLLFLLWLMHLTAFPAALASPNHPREESHLPRYQAG